MLRNLRIFLMSLILLFLYGTMVYGNSPVFSKDTDVFSEMIQQHGSIMLLINQDNGEIVFANNAASKFYGYSVDKLQTMRMEQINTLSPDEITHEMKMAETEQRNYFIFKHRLADQSIRDVEVMSYPIEIREITYLFSVITDITDKLAMEAYIEVENQQRNFLILGIAGASLACAVILYIINSQRKKALMERDLVNKNLVFWKSLLEYIIENDPNAIAILDKDMRYMFASKRYIKDYHIDSPDIIGKSHYEIVPDIPERWKQVHRRVLEGSVEKSESEEFLHPDGSVDYTRYQLHPWYTQEGYVGGIVLYLEVINERKKQEFALRESEEQFRSLVEMAPDAIFLVVSGSIAYANRAAVDLLKVESANVLLGRNLADWIHESHRNIRAEHFRSLFEERKAIAPMEQLFVLTDGSELATEVVAAPIHYQRSAGALIYVRDISERKRLEKKKIDELMQTRQQQKMESIGTLASGVAHEINNPITGIINYAQLILDEDQNQNVKSYAKEIMDEGKRISEITGNLLFYSRQQKQSHSPADMGDIIRRTLSLIQGLLRKDQIEVILRIPEDLPQVKCRSQQIQQIIMNLLTNARDALNEKYRGSDPNKQIIISVEPFFENGRRWVRINVEDHGNGISIEHQNKLFDPFFTTKTREMGTGLGLPISYGLALDHHGRLEFDTTEGQGTRFYLILPVDNGWDL